LGEGGVQEISQRIDSEETRRLLTRLVRSRSLNPPGDVRDCAGIVAEELKTRGLPAEIVEEKPGVANVISHLEGKEAARP
jgi:acetylornithine deacetylase/succinyl-diaminopimelate desuccinylase-like protein